MEARATIRYKRISPRKARLVGDLIRGKKVDEALTLLSLTPKTGARVLEKLLRSAVANGQETGGVDDPDAMRVSEVQVSEGPVLKRFRPRARGRATMIRKRTSHITVVLSD
jgi:large subunit ribosomal protein L22